MMRDDEVSLLRCPSRETWRCGAPLTPGADALVCGRCGARWPMRHGIAQLYREAAVRGNDRLLRWIYDRFAVLHDPAVWALIPLFQTEGSEEALRNHYIARMRLDTLSAHHDGTPVRILEVGVGSGANIARVNARLPRGLPVEYWAMDLSIGMLTQLRARLARRASVVPGDGRLRLVMADAHALPYPDATFDRVFHVGGIGGYHDPAAALAEMARVARPETPIVVVDEQLDPTRTHTLYHRATFRAVTFYERNAHCPREHLPPTAIRVIEEQASRFFYCMTFEMPC